MDSDDETAVSSDSEDDEEYFPYKNKTVGPLRSH